MGVNGRQFDLPNNICSYFCRESFKVNIFFLKYELCFFSPYTKLLI